MTQNLLITFANSLDLECELTVNVMAISDNVGIDFIDIRPLHDSFVLQNVRKECNGLLYCKHQTA